MKKQRDINAVYSLYVSMRIVGHPVLGDTRVVGLRVAAALLSLGLVHDVDLFLAHHVQETHVQLLGVHYHIFVISDVSASTHHGDVTFGVDRGIDSDLSLVEVLVWQFLKGDT